MDAQNVAQRIRFDAEDKLPPEYWDRLRQQPQSSKMMGEIKNKQQQNDSNFLNKIDPNEWAQAPEFIPRHQQSLANSFGYSNPLSNIPFNNNINTNNNNGVIYGSSNPPNQNDNILTQSLMESSIYSNSSSCAFTTPPPDVPRFASMPPPVGVAPTTLPFNLQPIFNHHHQNAPTHPSHTQFHPFRPPPQACVPISSSNAGAAAAAAAFGNIVPKAGIGPPIAAIVLKKKRRRRSRRIINMNDFNHQQLNDQNKDYGSTQQHPNDPNNIIYESLNDAKQRLQWQPQKTHNQEFSSPNNRELRQNGNRGGGQMRSMSSEPDLASMTNSDNNNYGGRHYFASSSPTSSQHQINNIGGSGGSGGRRLTSVDSCPELSDEQLKLWDDILYNAVVNDSSANGVHQDTKNKMRKELSATKISSRSETPEFGENNVVQKRNKEKSGSPVMRTSIYELCPSSIYDEENNAEFIDENEKEKFLEEMSNSRSAVFDPSFSAELNKIPSIIDRPKTIEDSFNLIQQSGNELEDLKFKSPQKEKPINGVNGSSATQYMTYFNPKTNGIKNEVYNPSADYDMDPKIEEDYFEGMRIRVNAFDNCEDLELSESECPQPSRFQQLQWALQRHSERYVQVAPPDRACCSLM